MPFSKRLQEMRQRRLEELKQRRAEERRQSKLDRKLEAELEAQKEEERRIQAQLDYEAMVAELEAAQERRADFLARYRAQRQAEKKAAESEAEKKGQALDLLRQAVLESRRAERKKTQLLAQASQEHDAGKRAAQNKDAARQEQTQNSRLEKQQEEKRAAQAETRLQERRAAAKSQAKLSGQRQSQADEARSSDREQRQVAEPDAAKQKEQANAKRAADRRQRQVEEADAAKQKEQAGAKRAAVRAEQAAGQKAVEQQAALAEEQRAAGLQENAAAERRQQSADAARRQQRIADLLAATRQNRLAEYRQRMARDQANRQARDQKRQAAIQARLAEAAEQRKLAEKARQAALERRGAAAKTRQDELRQMAQADEQRQQQMTALRAAVRSRAFARSPLQDPLAQNGLSGELPWLRCTGNRIATILGDAVVLRGVNLLGLESALPDPQGGFAAGAGITPQTIDAILGWGANLIRLAISRTRVLDGGAGFSAEDYRKDLDWIIQRAAEGGAYTLLSLRRLDEISAYGSRPGLDGKPETVYVAPQPDFERFEMWRILAERYALEPAVLYDLFSAPHPPLAGDASGIESRWDLWTLWVQMSVADIRRVNPGALCFVSGMAAGNDLSGLPIPGTANLPIPNLVYTAQVFPRRDNPIPALLELGKSFPVFVSEWGGLPLDTGWGQRTAQVLRAGGAGWAAAHWNAAPLLARIERDQILPSSFGRLVQRALAEEGEPLAVSQPADPTPLSTLSSF
jgi:hypothetical protein